MFRGELREWTSETAECVADDGSAHSVPWEGCHAIIDPRLSGSDAAPSIAAADLYLSETTGPRVKFPHSPVHVFAEVMSWVPGDWRDDAGSLLTLCLTPEQARALGVSVVRPGKDGPQDPASWRRDGFDLPLASEQAVSVRPIVGDPGGGGTRLTRLLAWARLLGAMKRELPALGVGEAEADYLETMFGEIQGALTSQYAALVEAGVSIEPFQPRRSINS